MQDTPIHCPADADATEVEQMACEAPRPVKPGKPNEPTPQGSGPTSPPPPPVDK